MLATVCCSHKSDRQYNNVKKREIRTFTGFANPSSAANARSKGAGQSHTLTGDAQQVLVHTRVWFFMINLISLVLQQTAPRSKA
jgi:hypothetical protein